MACFWTDIIRAYEDCGGETPPLADVVYGGHQENFILFINAARFPFGSTSLSSNAACAVPMLRFNSSYDDDEADDYATASNLTLSRLPRFRAPDALPEFVMSLDDVPMIQNTPTDWDVNGLLNRVFEGSLTGVPALAGEYQYIIEGTIEIFNSLDVLMYSDDLATVIWDPAVDGPYVDQVEGDPQDDPETLTVLAVTTADEYEGMAAEELHYTIANYKGFGLPTCDPYDVSFGGQPVFELDVFCA